MSKYNTRFSDALIIGIFAILIILFAGEPDIVDALIQLIETYTGTLNCE